MVEMIAKNTVDPENKVLGISHTNCHERAVMVRDAILARIKVKEVVMVETAGLSTTYANDGGIIVVI
jgi:Ni2+-binding GTPase involved in maturation of urease and hydrogenase